MIFLTILGMLVYTVVLVVYTLHTLVLTFLSDEAAFNVIKWNWKYMLLPYAAVILGWYGWWVLIGSNIHISFGG